MILYQINRAKEEGFHDESPFAPINLEELEKELAEIKEAIRVKKVKLVEKSKKCKCDSSKNFSVDKMFY